MPCHAKGYPLCLCPVLFQSLGIKYTTSFGLNKYVDSILLVSEARRSPNLEEHLEAWRAAGVPTLFASRVARRRIMFFLSAR